MWPYPRMIVVIFWNEAQLLPLLVHQHCINHTHRRDLIIHVFLHGRSSYRCNEVENIRRTLLHRQWTSVLLKFSKPLIDVSFNVEGLPRVLTHDWPCAWTSFNSCNLTAPLAMSATIPHSKVVSIFVKSLDLTWGAWEIWKRQN